MEIQGREPGSSAVPLGLGFGTSLSIPLAVLSQQGAPGAGAVLCALSVTVWAVADAVATKPRCAPCAGYWGQLRQGPV